MSVALRAALAGAVMRRLAPRDLPTIDLYVRNALRDALKSGGLIEPKTGVLKSATARIVVRHDQGQLPSDSKRLILVIDDDVRAGASDSTLPATYRLRLRQLDLPRLIWLEAQAEVIVTSSTVLARRYRDFYPQKSVRVMPPAWPIDPLPEPAGGTRPLRVALLAGLSHRADAAPLFGMLDALLVAGVPLCVTLSANLAPPRHLTQRKGVTLLPALNWPAYRVWMQDARFDLLLYPQFGGGAFNAARSGSKLGEAAQLGAALMAPEAWLSAQFRPESGRAIGLPNDADAWAKALQAACADPARVASIAGANRAALIAEDAPRRQREAWRELLDL